MSDRLLDGIEGMRLMLDEKDKQLTVLIEYIRRLEAELSKPLPEGNKEVGIV